MKRPSDRRAGFALAPVLYLLGLIGVTSSVLFSGYSQIIRSNIAISDSLAVKNDLNAATQILAGSSKLGTDGATLCPPPGASPGASCSAVAAKMANLSSISSSDVHLPTIYNGGNAVAITQGATIGTSKPAKEVGAFLVGSGMKQLDPWGHYYIYCRWENTTTTGSASPALMMITAGADGELETNCDAAAAATPFACNLKANCDDTIYFMNVATAINHSTLWTAGTTTVGSSTVADVTYGASPLTVDAQGNLTVPGTSLLEGVVTANTAVNVGGNLTGAGGGTLAIGSNTTVAGNLTTTGSVGVATPTPQNKLDVSGGVAIGTSYAGITGAPANGAIIQGSVGIGTSSPASPLDIEGTTNYFGITGTFANTGGNNELSLISGYQAPDYIFFNSNGCCQYIESFDGNTGNLAFMTGSNINSPRQIVFTPTGYVGIGTTSPLSNLQVSGGPVLIDNQGISGYAGFAALDTGGVARTLAYLDSGNNAQFGKDLANSTTGASFANTYIASGTGNLIFQTNRNTTQMTITNAGYVGIGTSSPGATLQVNGAVPLAVVGNSATYTSLNVQNVNAAGDTGLTFYDATTTAQAGIGWGNSSFALANELFLTTTDYPIVFLTNSGNERMRITAAGNVGIGTTSPSTALQVNGTITGTVPVTDLNSGTSASISTYWRGDGTWATVALGTSTTGTLPVSSLSGAPTGGSGPYNQVYVNSQGLVTSESYTATSSTSYDIAIFMPTTPGAGVIVRVASTRPATYPAGLSGSACVAKTGATSSSTITVNQIHSGTSTAVGTITFAASGSANQTCTFSSGSGITLAAGDILEFAFPNPADATLANIAITIEGNHT